MIHKFANLISKIYHYSIALTRKESGSVAMGFAYALIQYAFQAVMLMAMMFLIRGGTGAAIRGEFGVFVITGIGLFLLHNKIFQELSTPDKNRSLMPMLAVSPGILIFGSVLHIVYMQTTILAIFAVGIWIYYGGVTVEQPLMVGMIYILTIAWSITASMCVYSIVPIWPTLFKPMAMVYRRLGVITSGKMIPGNLMVGSLKGLFVWNPLFHCIDQIRGAVFLNYNPHNSNLQYPVTATIYAFCLAVFLYIGLRRFR